MLAVRAIGVVVPVVVQDFGVDISTVFYDICLFGLLILIGKRVYNVHSCYTTLHSS